MQYFKLEGPALDAWLKLIDNVKREAARVNSMDMNSAWGPNGALELLQLLPANLGRATINSTTHYGYRYSVVVGATTGLINTAIAAQRVVGIWGYVDTTPVAFNVDQLNITIGTRLARQWPVKPTQAEMNQTANRLDPLTIPASKTLTITAACHVTTGYAAGGFECTFLGVFAQPKA